NPLAGAGVALSGPQSYATRTDENGAFSLTVVPGIYAMTVSRSGYGTQTITDYSVVAGQTYRADVALAAQTLTSLQTIGRVTTRAGRRGNLNVTPAAQQSVTAAVFADQGQNQIMQVLDQLPGYVTAHESANANPTSPGAASYPNIRGSLTYETASLVDGHAVARSQGGYRTQYLNPALFQDVEVVKGPGAEVPNINYAIGGAVNFRTLEPTARPVQQFEYGTDNFGGEFGFARATGTLLNGRLGYALVYALNAAHGPVQGFATRIPINQFTQVNGQYVNSATVSPVSPAPPGIQNPAKVGQVGLYACCEHVNTFLMDRAELAKLRYKLSDATSVTATYLGTHGTTDENGNHLWQDNVVFNPSNAAAGYSDVGPGTAFNLDDNYVGPQQIRHQDEPIIQLDLRTQIHKDTVLARYFGAVTNNIAGNGVNNPAGSFTEMLNVYGSTTTCLAYTPGTTKCVTPGPTQTYNGQLLPVTFGPNPGSFAQCVQPAGSPTHYNTKYDPTCTAASPGYAGISGTNTGNGSPTNAFFGSTGRDALQGGSLEYFHNAGPNVYTFSVDSNRTASWRYNYLGDPNGMATAPGTSYAILSYMARADLALAERLSATLSTYFNKYFFRTSFDQGVTFNSSAFTHVDERLGLTYRPNDRTNLRLAIGSAIAPPYIDLLDAGLTPNGIGTQAYTFTNAGAGSFYTTTLSNPFLRPETAFGFDLGSSFRTSDPYTVVDLDVYRTNLFNQYVNARSVTGTYNDGVDGTGPLYTTQWVNLANARYEGVEASVRRDPALGFGYVTSLALIRAYPYNLTPTFYGKNFATNLAVVPNVNYIVPGDGTSVNSDYNGIARNNIPYAQGYGEISWRTAGGGVFAFGETYYGSNNSFNRSAFTVANAMASFPVAGNAAKYGSVQVTAYNIFNVFANPYVEQEGGIPEILVNGKLGYTNGLNVGPARLEVAYRRTIGH
ncbi:MAG: TonB-dependent receptor, partial [Candidatus Eremiobacteraeota bacterium]|nr:TonB-dependent receptor [Candidatus Eremiobacteraeota bacterium]